MTPVYVPSKGRSAGSQTLRALTAEAYPGVVICSPSDEQSLYRERYGWPVIEQEGTGIGNARQTCLQHARAMGHERFWMLDDDVTGAFVRSGTRFEKSTIGRIIDLMESAVELSGSRDYVTMFGPNFRHRAWSGPPAEMDAHLRNFVCLRTDVPGDYWPHVKEDLDMVLQIITAGGHTVRFNFVAFDSPRMGTTEGGCWDDYLTGALDAASMALASRWPGLVEVKLDDASGMVTNRVNWRAVRARTIKGPREVA